MPVEITTLGLNRVRRTDASPQLTVDGTGFSPANNTVLVSGSAAPIVVQGATQITFDLPAPFSLDLFAVRSIHVEVVVVNNDTGERSTEAYTWIKADLDEAADERLRSAIPGPFEVTGAPEAPERFEARDMERLAALVEALIVDLEPGNVLAWDGSKLAEPAGLKGSGGGQVLLVDPAEPTGLKWGFRLDTLLQFGGTSTVAGGPTNVIAAGWTNSSGLGSENWALDDGTLDLISLRIRQLLAGVLDRVRVLVNGAPAYDSGAGLAATGTYVQGISVAVTKGDQIELEVTAAGIGAAGVSVVGGIRLLID